MEQEIVSTHDGLGIAYAAGVCVVLWRQQVTAERFERQRAALQALADRQPQGISFLCAIGEDVPPPDAELRKASHQMVAALGKRLRCVACVIEGEGFRAATTRSVLAGMALLLRSSGPAIRIVGRADDAAGWIAQQTGASERGVMAAHAQLLARLSA